MEKFAFILHPLDAKRDVSRKYPIARYLPESLVEAILRRMKPKLLSHIIGVRSPTGVEAEGWFVACPMTPKMMTADEELALQKILAAGKLAESLGARIIGLGAYTKIIKDAGVTIAKNLSVPVTTGNSYTVATALEATREAASLMGIDLGNCCAAVVGATGSIGRACAELLSDEVARLVLVGRNGRGNERKLMEIQERLQARCKAQVEFATEIGTGLADADVVITVTSAVGAVIYPHHLKSGAVVCDVARPRDVSTQVAAERDDVLVIEGGIVEVPGEVNLGFNFGLPQKMVYACMAEPMILALERRYESYTLGRQITSEQVREMARLSAKHGFKLSGFRSFERALKPEEIQSVRVNAYRRARKER